MNSVKVIYMGKEYIILHQSATGFCEIRLEAGTDTQVQLVHFSELALKK